MPSINERLLEFDQYKAKAKAFYDGIGKIQCPALRNEWVHFTSEGFNHLIYRAGKKKPRDRKTQLMRFELLPMAKEVIERATTFQEYEESYRYRKVNRRGKYVDENTLYRAWGLVAIINKFRIKVVITQLGNGKKEFYSVMPAWVTRNYRNIKLIENAKGASLFSDE